jgi:hypothetical protein
MSSLWQAAQYLAMKPRANDLQVSCDGRSVLRSPRVSGLSSARAAAFPEPKRGAGAGPAAINVTSAAAAAAMKSGREVGEASRPTRIRRRSLRPGRHLGSRLCGPSESDHGGAQLVQVERLVEERVDAEPGRFVVYGLVPEPCDENERGTPGMVPKPIQDGQTISPRHSKIGNDHRGRGIGHVAQVCVSNLEKERRAVPGFKNEMAVTPEGGGDELSHFCIVLCQEYPDRGRGAPILSELVVHLCLTVAHGGRFRLQRACQVVRDGGAVLRFQVPGVVSRR